MRGAGAAGPCGTGSRDTPPRVEVEGGSVVGVRSGALASYKGIPFAAPPVRELRWKAPQPVVPWQGDLVADRYSPMCLQPLRAKNSVFYLGEEPSSEDCLYLNVWSTASAGDKRPVMVFVYGGGWTIGSASLPLYGGEPLAKKGAVVVSFNYRVGALGFLAHPELTAEGGGASGNYGLMDMVAALEWVKANIARFGGDPANVTLYGQSAGSVAIALLAASPQANGLFHRAIGQSGGYALGGKLQTLADGEKAGVAAAEKLKAPSLKALRNLGGDAIMNGDNNMRPVVDGVLLPQQPVEIYAAGKQMKVPVLIGSNADEGTAYPVVMTPAAFEADARKRYGAEADAHAGALSGQDRRGGARLELCADARPHFRRADAALGRRAGEGRAGVHVPFQPRPSVRRGRRFRPADAGGEAGGVAVGVEGAAA